MSASDVDWEQFRAEQAAAFEAEQATPLFEEHRRAEPRTDRIRRPVRPRPSRRYDSPEELLAWHWARVKVAALWMVVAPLGGVSVTTAVIFVGELLL